MLDLIMILSHFYKPWVEINPHPDIMPWKMRLNLWLKIKFGILLTYHKMFQSLAVHGSIRPKETLQIKLNDIRPTL